MAPEIITKWIETLEAKTYDDESIANCFMELDKVQIVYEQGQDALIKLLRSVTFNASTEWLQSKYSQELVSKVCTKIYPASLFLYFSSTLIELKEGPSLVFTLNLLEIALKRNLFCNLLVKESRNPKLVGELQIQLVRSLSSFPDHTANKQKNVDRSSIFHYEKYFVFLGTEVAESLSQLKKEIEKENKIHTELIAHCIGQFCFTRKADSFFKALFPYLVYHVASDFILQRILHQIFLNIPDRNMESVLFYIFQHNSPRQSPYKLLGELASKNPKAKFVLQHKLLLMKHFKDRVVSNNIFSYMKDLNDGGEMLVETLQMMMKAWCSSTSIKQTPYEQHKYLSVSILVCVRFLTSLNQHQKDDLLQKLMLGMQNHLSSPDQNMRSLGMLVGEKLTESLNLPVKDESKLKFEYPEGEETSDLMLLCQPFEPADEEFYQQQKDQYQKIKETLFSSSFNTPEMSFSTSKSAFFEIAAIKKIKLLEEKTESVKDEKERDDGETEDSDDDDLQPYYIPEETAFSKVKKPMYIRDCMERLVSGDTREEMEVDLQSLVELIHKDPESSKEVAVELSKILLNMQNKYAIDRFSETRRNSLASLAALNPVEVAEYLTDEFYTEHYNLQQRIDILDVIVMAAGRISSLEKTQETEHDEQKPGLNSHSTPQPVDQLPWKQVVAKRIEAKTKRYGKTRKPVAEPKPIRFGAVSGYFFYPLMAGYDKRVRTMDLLGRDSIVLGRLLYTLGTLLYSSVGSPNAEQMCSSLLEFVTSLRRHSEPFVRRACVYCVSMVTAAAPRLTDRLAEAALEAREWLCGVIRDDDDTQTKSIAANALAMMDLKAREELKMDASIT